MVSKLLNSHEIITSRRRENCYPMTI
ncbi:unnamed protein product [Medioppia subpectinata]|uniref:Uncharacterized protein n=1 Tax=Medioppia subpectinata TaxID=1979941 RepID=A0A7R9PZ86_9ACAR|nr:unnamed protein product [Medioppia subpectinata]CAG2106662.1 unnamed protein product [Medioppia subpectinata]